MELRDRVACVRPWVPKQLKKNQNQGDHNVYERKVGERSRVRGCRVQHREGEGTLKEAERG